MLDVEVIVLAQGTQQRLGMAHGYKQLLPLPGCGGTPILVRTLRQLSMIGKPGWQVTVLGWNGLTMELMPQCLFPNLNAVAMELPDPGNSSLKGIARYLENQAYHRADATIVLLGDVVYSWACLYALVTFSGRFGFVGTSNLSSSGGELWGVAWHQSYADIMLSELRDAMLRHPPFDDEYQPGQLRRWITGWRHGELTTHVASLDRRGAYCRVDDYTMDVDLPHHIPLLDERSVVVAQDDVLHGVIWGDETLP